MARGRLSLFEDPVTGPATALGLLSTGLGLLTSDRPGQAIQSGLGGIQQALLYRGQQQQEQAAEEEQMARQTAAFQRFGQRFGGAPALPHGPPGGGPPNATAAPPAGMAAGFGGGSQKEQLALAVEIMSMSQDAPALAKVGAEMFANALKPPETTEFERLLSRFGGDESEKAAKIKLNLLRDPESLQRDQRLLTSLASREGMAAASRALQAQGMSAADADRDASRAATESYRAAKLKQGGTPMYDAAGNITGYLGGGGRPPSGFQASTQTGLTPIPGGPAAIESPSDAGRKSMVRQARSDIEGAKKIAFDEKGRFNRTIVGLSSVPGTAGLGEEGRMLHSRIDNAVSAKYRLETGSAGNAAEEISIANRFYPSVLDTAKSAKDKFDRLDQFMDMSLEEMVGYGYHSPGGGVAATEVDAGAVIPGSLQIEDLTRELTPEEMKKYELLKSGGK